MARLDAAKHQRITLALAVLAVILLALSGPGTRFGAWSLRVGVGLFGGALLLGLAAAGAAVVGLAVPILRARSTPVLVGALVIGLASAAVPLYYVHRVMTVPYINDITTDTENPPQFASPKTYPSYFGELQQIGYPDLRPLELAIPPARVFARAVKIADDLGWEVTTVDERAGRIEALVTTRWFGFKDDVVIRITPVGAGSRVDMRSKSRFGRSDFGTNAHRIHEFLAAMDARE